MLAVDDISITGACLLLMVCNICLQLSSIASACYCSSWYVIYAYN